MKLQGFKRLLSTDFPKEFQKMIDTLSLSYNVGLETLYQALNKQLNYRDNLSGTVKDITVVVDSSGVPTQGGVFKLESAKTVDGVRVGFAINQDNSGTYPTSCPFISGSQNGQNFTIRHISGLQAGQAYRLRVIVDQQ